MTWNGFKLFNGLDDGFKSVQRFQGFGQRFQVWCNDSDLVQVFEATVSGLVQRLEQRFQVWCNGSDLIHVYGVTVSGLVQRFRFGSVWNNGLDLVQGFHAFRFGSRIWSNGSHFVQEFILVQAFGATPATVCIWCNSSFLSPDNLSMKENNGKQ